MCTTIPDRTSCACARRRPPTTRGSWWATARCVCAPPRTTSAASAWGSPSCPRWWRTRPACVSPTSSARGPHSADISASAKTTLPTSSFSTNNTWTVVAPSSSPSTPPRCAPRASTKPFACTRPCSRRDSTPTASTSDTPSPDRPTPSNSITCGSPFPKTCINAPSPRTSSGSAWSCPPPPCTRVRTMARTGSRPSPCTPCVRSTKTAFPSRYRCPS